MPPGQGGNREPQRLGGLDPAELVDGGAPDGPVGSAVAGTEPDGPEANGFDTAVLSAGAAEVAAAGAVTEEADWTRFAAPGPGTPVFAAEPGAADSASLLVGELSLAGMGLSQPRARRANAAAQSILVRVARESCIQRL